MSLINQAAELFLNSTESGNNLDVDTVSSALTDLLPTDAGDLDIASLAQSLGGGMLSIVNSWLGDGDDEAVDGTAIVDALGGDRVSAFAQSLGMDEDTASNGLAGMIPNLISDNTDGGSMLDSVGGVDGIVGLAKKFF